MPVTPADARDAAASRRDAVAEERDHRAMTRDRQARALDADGDPGFAARFLSAVDRDSAAGDRAEALADRRHASHEQRASSAEQVPPSAKQVPPSATQVPPSATQVPPSAKQVPSTATQDTTGDAASERRRATAIGQGATIPYFSDEPDQPGGLTPTPLSSRMPCGIDPAARLAAVLARKRLVGVAQGMVMEARQVNAEDASRLLLEAMDLRGHRLLDVAGALVEESRDRPASAPSEVGPPVGGPRAESRRTL